MEYSILHFENATVETALFTRGRREAHAIIHADCAGSFTGSFSGQWEAVNRALTRLGEHYAGMRPVFRRYFFSDIRNQTLLITIDRLCPTSCIQQPPLDGSKVVLWVVLQENPDFREVSPGVWEDSRGHLVFENPSQPGVSSFDATVADLDIVASELESRGASLLDNCVRTWFMVHDIDNNYAGVVEGRNLVFDRKGLTHETHFITSTGIGGTPDGPGEVVSFNAICDTRLIPGQMRFVYGASHLNPTIEYGVAFERGTVVDYGDRRHVYISGTASIDNKGEIVHPGDIRKQTERMIENISVLLEEAGCGRSDIAHLLVYLRDIADFHTVSSVFDELLPGVPRVLVLAPVCRPGWLVETECIAIKELSNREYPDF